MQFRTRVWHRLARRRSPRDVSIISDDCWGGQYYRILGCPYLTPTVGCWVEPGDYLNFVADVLAEKPLVPVLLPNVNKYPLLGVGSARLHFIHDHDGEKTLETFVRRARRLQRESLYVKIDLGKGYSAADVSRWNRLALPNSVALYPRRLPPAAGAPIHHGIAVRGWDYDGAKMYALSQRHFDVVRWLKTGRPGRTSLYTLASTLLLAGS